MRTGTPRPAEGAPSLLPSPFLVLASPGAAASVDARTVGAVLALTARLDGATSERCLLPSPPWDHVCVLAVRHGAVRMEARGRTAALAPGDVAVLDCLRPFRLLSDGGTDVLLVVPRVLARALTAPTRHGAVVRAAHPASDLLHATVAALADPSGDLSARGATAAAGALATLLAACTADACPGSATALERRLAERVDEGMASADLSPARLAADLGVSRATLYRAVGGADGIAGLVRERKLDRAFAILSDPGMAGESLGSVARMVGFSGTDQLSRLFLARFGQRAAEIGSARQGSPAAMDGGRIAAWMETFGRSAPGGSGPRPEEFRA